MGRAMRARRRMAILTDEQIEAFAIRVALGSKGGTWAGHYTETQREHWRAVVRDLAEAIALGMPPMLSRFHDGAYSAATREFILREFGPNFFRETQPG